MKSLSRLLLTQSGYNNDSQVCILRSIYILKDPKELLFSYWYVEFIGICYIGK